jgi:hypothetical protein
MHIDEFHIVCVFCGLGLLLTALAILLGFGPGLAQALALAG